MLIIAELESETAEFKFELYDTLTIKKDISEIVKSIRKEFPDRKVHIKDKINHHILGCYKLDLHYFGIAIKELLLNAIKFSADDVIVNISNKTTLSIEVIDKGIGLPSAQSINQFQLFYKTKLQAAPKSGMGIGLKILNHIIAKHNWETKITSAKNSGTNIKLSLQRMPIN